jgi:hypothetical protein
MPPLSALGFARGCLSEVAVNQINFIIKKHAVPAAPHSLRALAAARRPVFPYACPAFGHHP